jgi:hypothetical protein
VLVPGPRVRSQRACSGPLGRRPSGIFQDGPVQPLVVGGHPGQGEPPLGGSAAPPAADLVHAPGRGGHLILAAAQIPGLRLGQSQLAIDIRGDGWDLTGLDGTGHAGPAGKGSSAGRIPAPGSGTRQGIISRCQHSPPARPPAKHPQPPPPPWPPPRPWPAPPAPPPAPRPRPLPPPEPESAPGPVPPSEPPPENHRLLPGPSGRVECGDLEDLRPCPRASRRGLPGIGGPFSAPGAWRSGPAAPTWQRPARRRSCGI